MAYILRRISFGHNFLHSRDELSAEEMTIFDQKAFSAGCPEESNDRQAAIQQRNSFGLPAEIILAVAVRSDVMRFQLYQGFFP